MTWFMALLTFGMPLAVIALYYAIGWKIAVLAFPLLFIGLMRRLTSAPKADAGRAPLLRRVIGLACLAGIPVAAVAWDEPEIMRVWAYATALPISLGLALDKRQRVSRSAAVLAGILFVAASDLIWLLGSMAGWIWFHAFAFPILLFGFAFLGALFRRRHAGSGKTTEFEPPPRADDDLSAAAIQCIVVYASGERRVYNNASLSQAQAIYGTDWRDEASSSIEPGEAGNTHKKPAFFIRFKGNGILKFEADGPSTNTVQWTYWDKPQKGKFLGFPTLIGEAKVPTTLGPQVIADVWEDDTVALKARLEPFNTAA